MRVHHMPIIINHGLTCCARASDAACIEVRCGLPEKRALWRSFMYVLLNCMFQSPIMRSCAVESEIAGSSSSNGRVYLPTSPVGSRCVETMPMLPGPKLNSRYCHLLPALYLVTPLRMPSRTMLHIHMWSESSAYG